MALVMLIVRCVLTLLRSTLRVRQSEQIRGCSSSGTHAHREPRSQAPMLAMHKRARTRLERAVRLGCLPLCSASLRPQESAPEQSREQRRGRAQARKGTVVEAGPRRTSSQDERARAR